MDIGVTDFVRATLPSAFVRGKRVLDVGSLDWNGSVRDLIISKNPAEYVGIDILEGEGVDEVLSANDLLDHYGPKRWDIIVCLEMLEHCEAWQDAVYQMKESLVESGCIVLTTRSPGFSYHAPPDHWRFTDQMLLRAFADLKEVETWNDPGLIARDPPHPPTGVFYEMPGVFLRGWRDGPVNIPNVIAFDAPEGVDPGQMEGD